MHCDFKKLGGQRYGEKSYTFHKFAIQIATRVFSPYDIPLSDLSIQETYFLSHRTSQPLLTVMPSRSTSDNSKHRSPRRRDLTLNVSIPNHHGFLGETFPRHPFYRRCKKLANSFAFRKKKKTSKITNFDIPCGFLSKIFS